MIGLRVTDAYHSLRETELELASRHLQALVIQKQLESEARAEASEGAKAQHEWETLKDKHQKS